MAIPATITFIPPGTVVLGVSLLGAYHSFSLQ